MKKALLIAGDGWHAAYAVRSLLTEALEKQGYAVTALTDYSRPDYRDVDFADPEYDLVVLGRYGFEDVGRAPGKPQQYWFRTEQLEALERFVTDGGRLMLFHSGMTGYPEDCPITRLAHAWFTGHPPIGPIRVYPTGSGDGLSRNLEPFEIWDEEYSLKMDREATHVFLESRSPERGIHPQGWCHRYGKGRVLVFIPGHDGTVHRHPMIKQGLENAVGWLSGETDGTLRGFYTDFT